MDDATYGLVVAFDTDDPEFTRGFEAGLLWAAMEANDESIERMIHGTNAEMVMRMATAKGYRYQGEDVGHDWLHVVLAKDGD